MHYPTDVSLLWDALRCLIRVTALACEQHGLGGWRQSAHLIRTVRSLFHRVRSSKRRKQQPRRVQDYVRQARCIAERAKASLERLEAARAGADIVSEIKCFLEHAERQVDQVERRVLRGETIPQEEKVFSIFEPHTRWCAKGKAGRPVELGVPVGIVESEHGFVLHARIMWTEQDVDVAQPLVKETQAMYPDLAGCSFDKGFHSAGNREELDKVLALNALPQKGKLSKAARERESEPGFAAARKAHPAVESAIHNLECRGLDRVRSKGAAGFERAVGLAVLAGNLHRIGLLLQRREQKRLKRARKRALPLRLAA